MTGRHRIENGGPLPHELRAHIAIRRCYEAAQALLPYMLPEWLGTDPALPWPDGKVRPIVDVTPARE